VLIAVRRGTRGVIRTSFGAVAAAFVLAALLVLPATASSGPTRLSDPAVSPSSGTTATTFVFTVRYQNHEGSAPDHVSVVIDGTSHLMTTAAASWKQRATFSYSSKLTVGTHTVTFTSLDRDKFADSIPGGSVTVTAPPSPTPEGTPKPTPRPTPRPTPEPTPDPAPAATAHPSTAPTPTASPAGGSNPTPTPSPGSGGGSDPGASPPDGSDGNPDATDPVEQGGTIWNGSVPPGPDSFGSGGGSAAGPAGQAGTPTAGSGAPGAVSSGDAAGATSGHAAGGDWSHGWGTLTAFTEILGLDPVNPPALRLLPTLVGTTGGVTLMMAFLFFGKRRRDGEPPSPDEVLAAAAARGSGVVATSGLAVVPPALLDPDAELPRWRRPSLLQARKADPLRNAVEVAPLSFDHGLVGPVDGRERRLIRYTAVTLRDAPDELRSASIGSLTQGDEVQLLERSGTYWLVLCPDGRQGWIHKMTLGDVVGESPSPSASDTWASENIEADEVDDDVLTAFLAARSQA
jgi:hypothetical protein